jgi:hypothetical protein
MEIRAEQAMEIRAEQATEIRAEQAIKMCCLCGDSEDDAAPGTTP